MALFPGCSTKVWLRHKLHDSFLQDSRQDIVSHPWAVTGRSQGLCVRGRQSAVPPRGCCFWQLCAVPGLLRGVEGPPCSATQTWQLQFGGAINLAHRFHKASKRKTFCFLGYGKSRWGGGRWKDLSCFLQVCQQGSEHGVWRGVCRQWFCCANPWVFWSVQGWVIFLESAGWSKPLWAACPSSTHHGADQEQLPMVTAVPGRTHWHVRRKGPAGFSRFSFKICVRSEAFSEKQHG